jgi:hypothetical protein
MPKLISRTRFQTKNFDFIDLSPNVSRDSLLLDSDPSLSRDSESNTQVPIRSRSYDC